MIFSDPFHKNAAVAHRRRTMATTSALTDYEADLTSKDRVKQKEAIRRLLIGKVRDDWYWVWPKEDGSPTTVVTRSREDSEDEWAERDDWESDVTEPDETSDIPRPRTMNAMSPVGSIRFAEPQNAGNLPGGGAECSKLRKRRRVQEDLKWNDGLRCFVQRRDAWTCARHVRKAKPTSSSRRFSTFKTTSLSEVQRQETSAGRIDDEQDILVTEILIAPPILPPETPMRKGINEKAYATIYDKVVMQSQTPFCPINLAVITRSCVEGWKRDGEWPPKGTPAEASISTRSGTKSSFTKVVSRTGIPWLDREKSGDSLVSPVDGEGGKDKGGFRRSLQKVLGVVHSGPRPGSKGKEGETVAKE